MLPNNVASLLRKVLMRSASVFDSFSFWRALMTPALRAKEAVVPANLTAITQLLWDRGSTLL